MLIDQLKTHLACSCSTLIGKYQLVYVFSEKYQTGGKVGALCKACM